MLARRQFLSTLFRVAVPLLAGGTVLFFRATPALATTIAELRDQLKFGLRARLPEEFLFLERIVAMVEQGTLPLLLVQSTFQWARKKRPYPFQFFKRGIILRAAKQGITIEP